MMKPENLESVTIYSVLKDAQAIILTLVRRIKGRAAIITLSKFDEKL